RILASEMDGEHVTARYADDAMWANLGDAKPIADVYADNGVHLTKAGKGPHSRVNGWQRVRSYLSDGPACPMHRAQGWATCPMLHMFPAVESLYRELRDLPHAMTGDPEDADSNAVDHAADALRYLLINLGAGPEFTILDHPPPAGIDLAEPLGQFARIPRDDDQPSWWDADELDEDADKRGRVCEAT